MKFKKQINGLQVIMMIAGLFSSPIFAADNAELERRIDQLSQELASLKLQFQQQKEQSQPTVAAKPSADTKPVTTTRLADSTVPEIKDTTIGGYGEITYSAFRKDSSRNVADLRRLVLLVGHRFNDQLSFNSEIEWEHAVTSSTDKGESEIEQAFLDYHLASGPTIRAGLFLIPLAACRTEKAGFRFSSAAIPVERIIGGE